MFAFLFDRLTESLSSSLSRSVSVSLSPLRDAREPSSAGDPERFGGALTKMLMIQHNLVRFRLNH